MRGSATSVALPEGKMHPLPNPLPDYREREGAPARIKASGQNEPTDCPITQPDHEMRGGDASASRACADAER